MKKLTTLLFLSFLAAVSVRADLIWYEGFQYPNGSIETNSSGLWVRESGTASPTDLIVVNSNLQVSATGGTLSRQDDCDRLFAVTGGSQYTNHVQVVYASFTVICTNLPNGNGSYFASFYNTSWGYCGRVMAFTNGTILPNTWRLGVTDNKLSTNAADGGFPMDLALNTPYQVVEELDPLNIGAATIWINPLNINQTGNPFGANPPTETHYTASDGMGFATSTNVNSYAFRQGSSFGNSFFLITNLTVATTFAEAATNVWSTNAFAPTIVYQPAAATTNYQNAAVSLSAVANGQGLGNLTYQWQVSSSPLNTSPANVSNSNGNTNILSVPTSSTGTRYYTLVVTTPFGLSVTSSVAKMVVKLPNGPPMFITQPVSQTTYKGTTATLSTTVLSPGNIYYTWYSNNVVISSTQSPAAGQTDDGQSSYFVFNNAQTNFSASYKVAVTNDTTATGIVSTNAVLTVLNPAQITIAYLRTLVDPNNGYASTNNPSSIPYQVTGIITTYTNTTSGDTASYYLQDATAGIDLFVTGGSTFRPAQGDVVTAVAVVSTYTGGLEVDVDATAGSALPYTSVTDTGVTNALPAPISIGFDIATNTDNLNYNLEGSLVKLSGVYFGTNAGTVISTTANEYIMVTNSSGQSFRLSFFDLDLNTAGQTLPAYASSVTGALYGQNTNTYYSVAVTRFADIVAASPPVVLVVSHSGGNNLVFNWSDATYSLQSATNVLGPFNTILGATSGFTTNTTSHPTLFFRLYHP